MSERKSKARKTHYHSTISRRDFMKALGLGAGTVAATGFAKPFTDLDEAIAHPAAQSVQPWWVKEVDQPTTEIDWDRIERFDQRKNTFSTAKQLLGEERYNEVMSVRPRLAKEGILENKPGWTLRDQALVAAEWGRRNLDLDFTGPVETLSPEEQGVPRWEGTPEENARMIRVAARYFGASDVGFVRLDERTKKLLWGIDGSGRELVFENVDQPYTTEDKKVFPDKDLWAIVYMVPQSLILTQRGEFGGFGNVVGNAYARCVFIEHRMHDFLHAIGYLHMGGGTSAIGPSPAWAVMAGLGELGRTNRLVSPKYGNTLRTSLVMITDLPVAESKPIDAGIWKFCQSCKRCADECPSGAISTLDEPSWEVRGPWNNPGIKGYYDDALKCWEQLRTTGCTTCHAVCPFNKMDQAVIHDLVKISIAKLPVFNDVLRTMDEAFGYGLIENPEDFWTMEDLPLEGIDPSRV